MTKGTAGPVTDEMIYQAIYEAIVEHRLAPGAKLSQDELGEIFGVSKTRVRPILFRLAEQKIVTLEPNRGAFVAKPSLEEVRDVLAARLVVEEGIMREVARNVTGGQIAELRALIDAERDARLAGESSRAHRLSGQFHMSLAEMTGNPVLVDLLRYLISRNAISIAMYQPNVGSCSLQGHTEIVDALAARDEERVVEVSLSHLRDIARSLDPTAVDSKRNSLRGAFTAR
ncbi:MAG: GntR family transcriptional regulator [Azoarcus sp.]|nr:GntR family transcriptional regulator [Azoarcus sp.]